MFAVFSGLAFVRNSALLWSGGAAIDSLLQAAAHTEKEREREREREPERATERERERVSE